MPPYIGTTGESAELSCHSAPQASRSLSLLGLATHPLHLRTNEVRAGVDEISLSRRFMNGGCVLFYSNDILCGEQTPTISVTCNLCDLSIQKPSFQRDG